MKSSQNEEEAQEKIKQLKAPIYERLINAGQKYKSKHTAQAEENSGKDTEGCTFKPQTLKYKSAKKTENPEKKADKWSELYKMAEKKKERKNRNMDEIEIEKAQDEFTFKPKISQRSLRMEMNPNSPRRKQQMKAATDSGITGGRGRKAVAGNQEEFVFDIRTDAEPLLHVDVNLPNKNVRVALYEDSDVGQVAANFVAKYGLEQQMELTLRQTLEQHMQAAIKDQ